MLTAIKTKMDVKLQDECSKKLTEKKNKTKTFKLCKDKKPKSVKEPFSFFNMIGTVFGKSLFVCCPESGVSVHTDNLRLAKTLDPRKTVSMPH